MAKTPSQTFTPQQRNILNFRPNIHFVEPEQVDDPKLPAPEPVQTLDQIKTDVSDLISNYKNVQTQADDIQSQIDDKAKNVIIQLDPKQDSLIIQIIRRHFNDPNKNSITYDDYVSCLNEINTQALSQVTTVDQTDILSAASDPNRDVFGALGTQSGLARPELSSHAQVIPPLDMNAFIEKQIENLLIKLTPGITVLSTEIAIKVVKDLVKF